MIQKSEKMYDQDDVGNSDYRRALRSQQDWLESNGTPFEEQIVLGDVEDWMDEDAEAEKYSDAP